MNDYTVFGIIELLDTLGEETMRQILSEFSCPINPDIEHFVRENAIDFARRKLAVTHLVFDSARTLLGIFALTHKALELRTDGLSKTIQNKLRRFATFDGPAGFCTVSAFLIAQFGKNYTPRTEHRIDGNALMQITLDTLKGVQCMIGGSVVYLECENEPKLLSFYQNDHNLFRRCGSRLAEETEYIQLFRLL